MEITGNYPEWPVKVAAARTPHALRGEHRVAGGAARGAAGPGTHEPGGVDLKSSHTQNEPLIIRDSDK